MGTSFVKYADPETGEDRYAIWSSMSDSFYEYDLTRRELREWWVDYEIETAAREANKRLDRFFGEDLDPEGRDLRFSVQRPPDGAVVSIERGKEPSYDEVFEEVDRDEEQLHPEIIEQENEPFDPDNGIPFRLNKESGYYPDGSDEADEYYPEGWFDDETPLRRFYEDEEVEE